MIKIDVQPHRRGASRHRSRVRAAYHTDPEQEMRKILALLPNFEIFCLRSACAESRRFEIAAIKEGQFEADLVYLPHLTFLNAVQVHTGAILRKSTRNCRTETSTPGFA